MFFSLLANMGHALFETMSVYEILQQNDSLL